MNPVRTTPGLNLTQEIAAYVVDFELMRIAMRAGCRPRKPYEALERLWTLVHKAAPAAGNEISELIVAHRRALGIFRDLGHQQDGSPSAALRQARAAHFAALAALLVRLGARRPARGAAPAP